MIKVKGIFKGTTVQLLESVATTNGVEVVDIFGNDTMKIMDIHIGGKG